MLTTHAQPADGEPDRLHPGRWSACSTSTATGRAGRRASIFSVAATTDYVDGYLARNWQQQSLFGRWLDPIADKLLVAAAVVMLVGFGRAPLLPSLVIVLREITVSGLREYMAEVSVGLPVSRLAKWKTAVQMTAIGFLLVGSAGPGLAAGRGDRLVGPVARGRC